MVFTFVFEILDVALDIFCFYRAVVTNTMGASYSFRVATPISSLASHGSAPYSQGISQGICLRCPRPAGGVLCTRGGRRCHQRRRHRVPLSSLLAPADGHCRGFRECAPWPCHICAGTELSPATSAPELGLQVQPCIPVPATLRHLERRGPGFRMSKTHSCGWAGPRSVGLERDPRLMLAGSVAHRSCLSSLLPQWTFGALSTR